MFLGVRKYYRRDHNDLSAVLSKSVPENQLSIFLTKPWLTSILNIIFHPDGIYFVSLNSNAMNGKLPVK